VGALRGVVAKMEARPDGLSPTASKLWASTSAAASLLRSLEADSKARALAKPRTLSAADGKLREVVVGLAELLEVANARVVKALDDEGKNKEAIQRLESKIAQIISKTAKSPVAAVSSSSSSSSSATSNAMVAEAVKELIDARKQLAAMAKDNGASRLTRATAQEQALADDLKDLAFERASLLDQAKRHGSAGAEGAGAEGASRLGSRLKAAEISERRAREELDDLQRRNRKLEAAVEERRTVRDHLHAKERAGRVDV
jgi:hypothetical protein